MHISQLLVQMKHFFTFLILRPLGLVFIMGRRFSLQAKIFAQLFRLGELVFKLHLPALRVVKLVLPDHLLALERLLVLLDSNQLLILHVFQLVLKIAKLSLLVLHLATGCLHVVLKLLFLIQSNCELLLEGDLVGFGLL